MYNELIVMFYLGAHSLKSIVILTLILILHTLTVRWPISRLTSNHTETTLMIVEKRD